MIPFKDGDTSLSFKQHLDSIKKKIDALSPEYIINVSKEELTSYWIQQAYITPLILRVDEKYLANKKQTSIEFYDQFSGRNYPSSGTALDICIPYSGNSELFKMQASTYSLSGYPIIEIEENYIIIKFKFLDSSTDPSKIRSQIDNEIISLNRGVEYVNADVIKHNNSIQKTIEKLIEDKIQKSKNHIGVMEGIGIPILKKETPEIYVVDINRNPKPKELILPKQAQTGYVAEPALAEEDYQHILNVLRSMSLVIERNPESFINLDEESIRTHFLIQLNGHYSGAATGETFNMGGKTDILLRVKDKNIFIAECKFWRGESTFNEAIDQLMGYLTWRDSKCALIVFNRTRSSTKVSEKMNEIMSTRSECKKIVFSNIDGDSRYVFVKDSDPGKEIFITTQIFDIPTE